MNILILKKIFTVIHHKYYQAMPHDDLTGQPNVTQGKQINKT